MRLNRLDLMRYGRFDNARIVLPQPAKGNPDITIIYGPNESGKSTAFHGFLELLFGMQPRAHPYAFKFNRRDLLIGAELEIPGRGVTLLRRNGTNLLDDQDRPIEEAMLSSALHGIGRDDYIERFSLNDKGLRDGGERIAGAKGDLGQLLHAGMSGLTNMAETLEAMTADAEQFHKKSGRNTTLKIGKDRLKEIGDILKTARLTPDRERHLREDRDTAQKAFEAADDALSQARKRQAAGKAAQDWYEQSEEIRIIDQTLADFPAGPDLKTGTVGQMTALAATISEKAESIAAADGRIARHERVIQENKSDPVAADLSVHLTQLEKTKVADVSLLLRADTVRSDLTKRIAERDEIARQIKDIRAVLNVPDVPEATLVLTREQLDTLENAVQACQTAESNLKTALDVVTAARGQLGEEPPKPQDLSQLQIAFDAWQLVAEEPDPKPALENAQTRLAKAVSGLPKSWSKHIETGLPARETLEEVAREWRDLASNINAATKELEGREAEYKTARARREADENEPSSIHATATEETRRRRDAAWQSHRSALTDETADRFEQAMYADDRAHTHYLMGTEARKQLAASRNLEATTKASRDTAQDKRDTLTRKRDDLSKRVASIATALGLPPDTGPDAFTERFSALLTSAEILAEVTLAQAALEDFSNRRKKTFDDLSTAARPVGIDAEANNFPERVRKKLTLQDSEHQAWKKWRDDKQAIDENEKAVMHAKEEQNAALTRLETLTATLPLPDHAPAGIRAALLPLYRLQQLLPEYENLVKHVDDLERAEASLVNGVARLAEILKTPFDPEDDPRPIIDCAQSRVLNAKNADQRRKREEDLLAEEIQNRTHAIGACDQAQNRLDQLFEGQGAADLPPKERADHLAKRDELRHKRNTADTRRNEAREGVERALFDEELAHLPNATRTAELQQELDDMQMSRDGARDLFNEKKRLYEAAYNAADNSEMVTERATILEELRSGARQAAVARLGVLAARGALKRLAAERRSTMLKDVEDAFVTITSEQWQKVEVWSEAEGEKLVGIKPGVNPVRVEDMSTGTMGQLYFALRLAGYRSFARNPGPLPMILDDILETFDDSRASATLKLCAEIGQSGQAIIFTHHAHLVELARNNIAGVSIVEMPG